MSLTIYITEKDTRTLLSLVAKRLSEYSRQPALTSVDPAMSQFKYFGVTWDVSTIFAASMMPWKRFEAIYKEERESL